ncbi:hypothetical protein GH714_018584 [Hevea brasiliensis]|uniref:AIG1-type G domain-containing protein n=1 Tax=Hevea brasiliensis TaxID=3981 RepID=A0A6A6MKR5_HEVBR|nr:hypothetical protein GH714_018584 [Hevea brasiliensis]
MASIPRVSLSKTQGSPSFSNSLLPSPTGSLPIRAPITPDDDSSDFESNGHTDHGYSDTSSNIDNGSESDEYVSVEEFESGSEKLFAGNPDEENSEESGLLDKNKLSRAFVPNPDEESLGSSFIDEESGVTDHYRPVVESDSPYLQRVMPVCPIVNGRFSAMVSAPRVRVSAVEYDKEDEPLVQGDSHVVNEIELLPVGDNEDLISGNFVGADYDVSGIEESKFAVKCSPNGSASVELIKNDYRAFTSEAQVEPLVENKENPEMKEDAKHVADEPVSVELVEDDGQVLVPEAPIEFLVESKEEVLGKYSQVDDDTKQFAEERPQLGNLEQEKIELNGRDGHNIKSMENVFMNHVSENCSASQLKEHVSDVTNGCGDTSELNQVENIVPDIREMKVDGAVLQEVQISEIVNSSNNSSVTVINSADESLQKIVPEPQEMKVEVLGVEAEKATDFVNGYQSCVFNRSAALEKGNDIEKLDGKSGRETGMRVESLAPEDAITVESVDSAFETNEIQTVDLLESVDFPEMFGVDRLEVASQGNTNSFGIRDEVNHDSEKIETQRGFLSDEDIEELIFGGSGSIERNMSELEKSAASSPLPVADDFHDHQHSIDGQIIEKLETDKEREAKKLFDSAALATLLKAATGVELDGAVSRQPLLDAVNDRTSVEEKKMIEKIQHIRVKFLRLVQRLGLSPEDSIVAQVLHSGKDELDFCLNIFVIGKTGVGKSATINSIFGEKKVMINAFEPATTRVKEIVGTIDGVRIRILDTPGLRSPVKEEATNRKILASIKKLTEKFPPDVVLYVDRLDTHARDLNDLPLLASLTNSLTASIWRNAIVTLTHAAAPPPDGLSGSP